MTHLTSLSVWHLFLHAGLETKLERLMAAKGASFEKEVAYRASQAAGEGVGGSSTLPSPPPGKATARMCPDLHQQQYLRGLPVAQFLDWKLYMCCTWHKQHMTA